jgi:hypothetical protein
MEIFFFEKCVEKNFGLKNAALDEDIGIKIIDIRNFGAPFTPPTEPRKGITDLRYTK